MIVTMTAANGMVASTPHCLSLEYPSGITLTHHICMRVHTHMCTCVRVCVCLSHCTLAPSTHSWNEDLDPGADASLALEDQLTLGRRRASGLAERVLLSWHFQGSAPPPNHSLFRTSGVRFPHPLTPFILRAPVLPAFLSLTVVAFVVGRAR